MATEAPKAFFSYSRDDSEFALRLAADLKAAGANVWLDQLDIALGERWARAVQHALHNSQRLLVILSPSSVESRNVEDEVAFAIDEHKTVIPVLYRDCKVPFQLRGFQYADFRTDYPRGLKALLNNLGVEQQPEASAAQGSAPPVDRQVVVSDTGKDVLETEGRKLLGKSSRFQLSQYPAWVKAVFAVCGTLVVAVAWYWAQHRPSEMSKARMFSPGCTLPFNGLPNPAIDDHCGIQGNSSDPVEQAQSRVMNNFCAPTQDPEVLTYQKLLDLQTQSADIPGALTNRKVVENLGEGGYVSYVANIKNARYASAAGGEPVNCNLSGNAANDIHLVLMADQKDTDECNSTLAEISPHYRPANWTPEKLNALGKPVRIKGQLFYDNGYSICTAHARSNPKRASLWEIHPVYSIEVCKSNNLDECRNSVDPAEWTKLE